MAASSKATRAGKAFVEIGAKDDKLTAVLRSVQRKMLAFAATMKAVGGALIAGFAVKKVVDGLKSMVTGFAALGAELTTISAKSGLAADSIAALRYAAIRGRVPFEAFEAAILSLNSSLVEAMSGSYDAAFAFARLGLNFRALAQMKPEQRLTAVLDALARVPNAATRAAAGMGILGGSVEELAPLLQQGPGALSRFSAEAARLGLVMSKADAEGAARLQESFQVLGLGISTLVSKIGSAVAPAVESMTTMFADAVISVGEWIDKNRGLITSLLDIKSAWAAMTNFISDTAQGFQNGILSVWTNIKDGWIATTGAISDAWVKATAGINRVWQTVVFEIRAVWTEAVGFIAKGLATVMSWFGGSAKALAEQKALIEQNTQAGRQAGRDDRSKAVARIDESMKDTLKTLQDQRSLDLTSGKLQKEDGLTAAAQSLKDSSGLLARAAKASFDAAKEWSPENRPTRMQKRDMASRVLGLPSGDSSVTGTFSAANVRGLGGNKATTLLAQILSATQQTATNTKDAGLKWT